MPLPQVEARPATIQPRKGIESVKVAEIKAKLQTGNVEAQKFSPILRISEKVETILGKSLTVAETRTKQTEPAPIVEIKAAHKKRAELLAKRDTAKKEKNSLETQKKKLNKREGDIAKLQTETSALLPDDQAQDAEGTTKALEATRKSKATVEVSIQTQSELAAEAQKQTDAIKYKDVLLNEIKKIPGHNEAQGIQKKITESITLVKQAEEIIPEYVAAQQILAARAIEQAKVGQPLPEVYKETLKDLDKAIAETRKTEINLAKKLDGKRKKGALGRSNRVTERITGAHSKEDQSVSLRAAELVAELTNPEITQDAITSAGDKVRAIIENPKGRKKSNTPDSLLTRAALDEAIEKGKKFDPIRNPIYKAMSAKQHSVDEALGCEIEVTSGPDGKRVINFKLPKKPEENATDLLEPPANLMSVDEIEEWGNERVVTPAGREPSVLFTNLTTLEATETALRAKLEKTPPEDLLEVRSLFKAIDTVDKEREALLGQVDARVNGLTTKDGVRSGALKTKMVDMAVKGGEATVAVVAVAGAVNLAINGHISEAQHLVSQANVDVAPKLVDLATSNTSIETTRHSITTMQEFLKQSPEQMKGLVKALESLSPTQIQAALNAIAHPESADTVIAQTKPVVQLINQMSSLKAQIASTPGSISTSQAQIQDLLTKVSDITGQINQIRGDALLKTATEKAGAIRDLWYGTAGVSLSIASMSEGVRKLAGRPIQWAKDHFKR
jgi:hypothetical protein